MGLELLGQLSKAALVLELTGVELHEGAPAAAAAATAVRAAAAAAAAHNCLALARARPYLEHGGRVAAAAEALLLHEHLHRLAHRRPPQGPRVLGLYGELVRVRARVRVRVRLILTLTLPEP